MKNSFRAVLFGAAFFIASVLAPVGVFAQGGVIQSGPVVAGHLTKWFANGIIGDAGSPSLSLNSPVSGQGVVWNGIDAIGAAGTAAAPNTTYPLTSLGIVSAGQNLCLYDAAVAAANHSLCFGTVSGVATITSAANNGASAGGLAFVVDGATITFPTSAGTLLSGVTAGGGITVTPSGSSPIISLATGANNTVMANISGGSAAPTTVTVPALFDSALSSTPGSVIWRSPSAWAALGPGANGTCLTYNTSGPAITWGSCAGSGGTGTITSLAAAAGIVLSPDPIVSTGTVGLAAIADLRVMANISGGSLAPSANTMTATLDATIGSTRGSLLERGGSGWTGLAPSATANSILISNGTGADPGYSTLTALIDAAIGSTRGSILYRGASGWAIRVPGTSGYALISQGAGADPIYANVATGATQPTQTVLNTAGSGTFTTPANAIGLHIRMVGGGGGGGGGSGSGGGGGSTTFGSLTAAGGGGGDASGVQCTPGAGSGGTINLSGGRGSVAQTGGGSGVGGASAFGGGGAGGATTSSAGLAPGSGGGGVPWTGVDSTGGCAGGYVESWILTPTPTYSYAVGIAGAGNGSSGAGAAGMIIIEARYY